jgi:anaerobic magnesium-protoporphyrin IX monomethyl ester cyclase
MKSQAKPDVILLYPKTGMDFGSTVAPPHSLLTIAAPLDQAGYRVAILDQRTQRITEETLKEMISSDLLCFGVSAMTGTQIRHALRLTRLARRLTDGRVPIVWGGPHPSITPAQTLTDEDVDIIVVGEGDVTFLELIQALEKKQELGSVKGLYFKNGTRKVKTDPRPLGNVEDLLPVPWHLVEVEKYIHQDFYVKDRSRVLDLGQTSRGCPFRCGFCSSASIRGRRWRPMSVDKSLEMIVSNVRRFKLDGFWLRDDEFYIDRKRAYEICAGMVKEKLDVSFYTSGTRVDVFMKATDEELTMLRRAGAHTLKFGAESGSQRILDLMRKDITVEQTLAANRRCRQYGFIPAFALVIGYPTETFADIDQTIDLAYRLQKENPQAQLESVATFTSLPATPSFALALEHGLRPPETLEGWSNWLFDEYDQEGARIPWYNRQERIYIGNIAYMSILANALGNAVGSIGSPPLRFLARQLVRPTSAYFRFRLKNKMYRHVPELNLVRYLRHKAFYQSDYTVS